MKSQQFVQHFLDVEVSKEAMPKAKLALLDYVSASLWARDSPELHQLKKAYSEQLVGDCVLIGDERTASSSFSALYNGFQAHLLDMDDTHGNVRGHPSAVLFSTFGRT
ncbi:MmgE/PrpD family protein [Enterococcus saccharolyticus]|uniref:MmgE/PrpD N-terminal domain-containing protein n=1 Tax=Enterococcus saccharolyticus subsp. saccharolyticus ATCC 43076 TaxID=1139996 RepID=S0NIK8_9ENTE|nr:MmgE/PrpD family protein [Enterococcus saccharolyticus]EOT29276.1 hypothetical protein OMQ_01228 [Enterococcus saccharolyticus subsp. saccharolyticus ATCC 43076]EOT81074.1 hypothetical protein I572_01606 [Enterococcus saccharolyticus subsp. saccharolyticus ATCC 43076]OJG86798.1 hypothetical protein RV16_GL000842 [Enterococcus saccharolyticus]